MDDFENLMDKLKSYLGEKPVNLNILEDKVGLEIQMEFFELSKKVNKKININKIISEKDNIFKKRVSIDNKKKLLCQLSSIEDVSVFRTLEKFSKEAPEELHSWSLLAVHNSRMLIESSFLDESQIFISTGLGGKGNKLRYNVIFISNTSKNLNKTQNKVIKNESELIFKQQNIEFEEIIFNKNYASLMVLIPIEVNLKQVFNNIISECNTYGDFLKSNFIITNVKVLEEAEIKKAINNNPNN